jgi:hypothetical protein
MWDKAPVEHQWGYITMVKAGIMALSVAAILAAVPASAQDGQFDASGSLLQGRLSQQIVDGQNRRGNGQSVRGASSARTRQICSNRRQVAAGLTAAKAQRLHALCAQAGYR